MSEPSTPSGVTLSTWDASLSEERPPMPAARGRSMWRSAVLLAILVVAGASVSIGLRNEITARESATPAPTASVASVVAVAPPIVAQVAPPADAPPRREAPAVASASPRVLAATSVPQGARPAPRVPSAGREASPPLSAPSATSASLLAPTLDIAMDPKD